MLLVQGFLGHIMAPGAIVPCPMIGFIVHIIFGIAKIHSVVIMNDFDAVAHITARFARCSMIAARTVPLFTTHLTAYFTNSPVGLGVIQYFVMVLYIEFFRSLVPANRALFEVAAVAHDIMADNGILIPIAAPCAYSSVAIILFVNPPLPFMSDVRDILHRPAALGAHVGGIAPGPMGMAIVRRFRGGVRGGRRGNVGRRLRGRLCRNVGRRVGGRAPIAAHRARAVRPKSMGRSLHLFLAVRADVPMAFPVAEIFRARGMRHVFNVRIFRAAHQAHVGGGAGASVLFKVYLIRATIASLPMEIRKPFIGAPFSIRYIVIGRSVILCAAFVTLAMVIAILIMLLPVAFFSAYAANPPVVGFVRHPFPLPVRMHKVMNIDALGLPAALAGGRVATGSRMHFLCAHVVAKGAHFPMVVGGILHCNAMANGRNGNLGVALAAFCAMRYVIAIGPMRCMFRRGVAFLLLITAVRADP